MAAGNTSAAKGFAPILFDLETDSSELTDLGTSQQTEHQHVRARMEEALLTWATQHHTRITATPQVLAGQKTAAESGILIGFWDEREYKDATGQNFADLIPVGRGT